MCAVGGRVDFDGQILTIKRQGGYEREVTLSGGLQPSERDQTVFLTALICTTRREIPLRASAH